MPPFYSLFIDTYCIYPYIFLCPLLLLTTSNSSSLTLSSSIFLHVQLPTHHNVTRLSSSSTSYPLAYILSLFSTLNLSLFAIYPLSVPLPIYLLLVLLLLLFLNYEFILLLFIFGFHCHFPLLLSSLVFYLVYLFFSIFTLSTCFKVKLNLDK